MKKAKLPLPVLVLIMATLFLVSTTLGEWIVRPSSTLRAPASETVEQQQAAILYLRVMSWISRVISRPTARTEEKIETAEPAELTKAPAHAATPRKVQLCALSKSPRPSMSLRKSSRRNVSRPQQSGSSRAVHSAACVSRDSSAPASGS